MNDEWIPVDGRYLGDEPAASGFMCWISVVDKYAGEARYVLLGFLAVESGHTVYTWRYWGGDCRPIENDYIKVVAYMPVQRPIPYIPKEG